MKRQHFARLSQCLCFTLLLVSACPAWAGSLHLGLGYSNASVRSDASGVDGSSGGGALAFGWEFAETWSLEFFTSLGHSVTTGVPRNIYYPADKADYSLVFIGLGKSLWSLNDHSWTPWIEAGFGSAELYWHTYYYQVSGGGLVLAGGVDVRMGTTPLVLRAQYLSQDFSTTDTYGDSSGSLSGEVLSVMLMYRFR